MLPLFRKPHFYMGYNPIVDEDWDELFVPALTVATKYIKDEGEGCNDFGPAITTVRKPIRAAVFKPHSAPGLRQPPPPPAIEISAPAIIHRLYSRVLTPTPDMQPLHKFCHECGWRMGGPDSYNGLSCKCGSISAPLIGRGGLPFFT
jgi:hypothetical protein